MKFELQNIRHHILGSTNDFITVRLLLNPIIFYLTCVNFEFSSNLPKLPNPFDQNFNQAKPSQFLKSFHFLSPSEHSFCAESHICILLPFSQIRDGLSVHPIWSRRLCHILQASQLLVHEPPLPCQPHSLK